MMTSRGNAWLLSRGGGVLSAASLVAMLSACSVTPEPFTPEELNKQALDDRADMFKGGETLTRPLSMSDAIGRALKYNLEKRSKMMDEALALGQTDLDIFNMLPKLTVDAGYNERSSPNATYARNPITNTTAATPSYSEERISRTLNLGLSWNILDFGVSYYGAHQNADRALVALEHRRKAVHTLVSDVRYAYWRAAAFQVLKDEVNQTVKEANGSLTLARTAEEEALRTPLESLRYQRALIETLRQLTGIQEELSLANLELAALINLPPGTEIILAVPVNPTPPVWDMGMDRMEEAAFINNPDLHEQGYLARIAVADTKKAILKMLPGISFSLDMKNDFSSLLVDNNWYEAGAKLSWNLMSLVAGPSSMDYAEANEEAVKARRIALRMAILAQVHISERQFRNASSQFRQSDSLWKVDKRLVEIADVRAANDAQGVLERVATHSLAIASRLRRFQTYAQTEQAFAKMQATLGRDLLPEAMASTDLDSLSTMVSARLYDWDKFDVSYKVETVSTVSLDIAPAAMPILVLDELVVEPVFEPAVEPEAGLENVQAPESSPQVWRKVTPFDIGPEPRDD